MRLLFVLFLFFFTTPLVAMPWSELEEKTTIRLKNDLVVAPDLTLPQGALFALNTLTASGPPYLQFINFRMFPCPQAIASRRIELALLDEQYGFELDWNCSMTLILELKDFYQESYFEPAP